MLPPLIAFLGANISEFAAKMGEAKVIAAETTKTSATGFNALAGIGKIAFLAVGAGAIAVGATLFELSKHIEETGNQAYEMSRKFGLSGTQASAWVQAASSVGVSADQISNSFKFLSRNIAGMGLKEHAALLKEQTRLQEAVNKEQQHEVDIMAGHSKTKDADIVKSREHLAVLKENLALSLQTTQSTNATAAALESLGVKTTDSTGKLRPMNDVMLDVAEGFKKMPDGPEKTALAMKLFGRAGQELIPVLNEGKEGNLALMEAARKSGAVLSNEQVEAAHKAFLAHKNYEGAVTGLTNKLSVGLLPAMTGVYTWLGNVAVPAVERMIDWTGKHSNEVRIVAGVIGSVLVFAIGAWIYAMLRAAAISTATAAISMAKAVAQAAVWIAQALITLAAWTMWGVMMAVNFTTTAIRAVVQAGIAAGAWVLGALRSSAAWAVAAAASIASGAAWLAAFLAQQALAALGVLSTIGQMVLMVVWMGIVRGATIAWTAMQWLLNIALDANPIGLIIIAIALLVVGIIWAYKNVGWFRDMVNTAWDRLKAFGDWLRNTFGPIFKEIGDKAAALGNALQAINPWAKGSPSLVENVQSGTQAIVMHYSNMSRDVQEALVPVTGGTALTGGGRGVPGGVVASAGTGNVESLLQKIVDILEAIRQLEEQDQAATKSESGIESALYNLLQRLYAQRNRGVRSAALS